MTPAEPVVQCEIAVLRRDDGDRSLARAKCKSSFSRTGNIHARLKKGRSFELRNKLKIGDRGASPLTCSSLNFCAHAITGRQTSWSMTMIVPIIVVTPQSIAPSGPHWRQSEDTIPVPVAESRGCPG